MSDDEKEMMLDLLCDKFVYGLSDDEARELDRIGYDPAEARSIEQTVATLGLVDLSDDARMPAGLQAKLSAAADDYFGPAPAEDYMPDRAVIVPETTGGIGKSWFGWLGWATAAFASLALAVTLFVNRGNENVAGVTPTPTPTPEERLDPAQQRQKMIESSPGQVIMAEWAPGKMPNVDVSGDVVWNAAKQVGYLRLKGLPKNDVSSETYQLWIVDGSQDPKTPIDGGTFDVQSDGEVIVPIDAKLKAMDPKAFAITVEKPGGVVVSTQGKLAALAPVKPSHV